MSPTLVAAMAFALGTPGAPQPGSRPNIVLILADDLGYGELGCYGGKDIPTPNIDAIAKGGVRFTDGYVSCPVCAPTRAGLLTGKYGPRFGFEFNPGPQAAEGFGLPRSEKTLAERLEREGYATGMVGKWHLGQSSGLTPTDRGFDTFFGFLPGAHSYRPGTGGILRGKRPANERAYLTDAFAREAVDFIERNKTKPFLLYLPFNAVHSPMEAPQRLRNRFDSLKTEKRRAFAGMLTVMDEAVGQVTAKLKSEGLSEKTLIVFLSDNGGPTQQTTSSNGILRGFKGQTWEGGIRVPFMMQWKGRIPEGQVYREPVIALDLAPTILVAAGNPAGAKDGLDGVDLLPFLTGQQKDRPHEALFWRYGPQTAIRNGDWKLVTTGGITDGLYSLKEDPGEKEDLAKRHPEMVRALKSQFKAWEKGLAEPAWGQRRRRSGR